MNEVESKKILSVWGIPTVSTRLAFSEEEAVQVAKEIGGSVVLKLFSETITHKSDVGGVKLHLDSPETVRNAFREIRESVSQKKGPEHFQGVTVQPMIGWKGYEVILGSSIDPDFGPVLLFGSGGTMVEVYQDRALGLPPLNTKLAEQMMEQTKIYCYLRKKADEKGIDLSQLSETLVKFSQMIQGEPLIKESDINPLLISPEGVIALDARIVLRDLR